MVVDPQSKFTLSEIEALAFQKAALSFKGSAISKIKASSKFVQKMAGSSQPIYGVNTGFGKLAQVRVSKQELTQLQLNLLRSHACGVGSPLSASIVRRLLVLRALSLGKGHSGISWPFIERHLQYLKEDLIPLIPEQGSVGASGDLAPLAHLGLTFIGEGYFFQGGKQISTSSVLRRLHWQPLNVGAKEGLALVNGTQVSLAIALEAREQLRRLLPWMEKVACLSIEGHRATAAVFDRDLHKLKAHAKQREVAARFAKFLADSKHMKDHKDCDLVQDAYSFRCIPQVLGPVYEVLQTVDRLLEDEANSVSDNPVVILKGKRLLSGGHFHAHSVGLAADMMSMAIATVGNLSERRIDQLVSPASTRSKAFLANRAGVESGLMIVQTMAAALASENKTLAHPATADTIPTNGNQEDHVSMAPWAGRKALMMVANLRRIVAAEMLCAVRACVLESTKTGLRFSSPVEALLSDLADQVPDLFLSGDREFGQDLQKIEHDVLS